MKKLASLFLFLSLLCALSVTAHAADEPPGTPPDTTVVDTSETDTEVALVVETFPGQPTGTSASTSLQPVSVKMEMVGDVPYITKVYEIAHGNIAQAQLAELDSYLYFDQDGYHFTRHDAYTQAQADEVERRTETKTATLDVEKDDIDAVIAAADPYVDFDDRGYSGRLELDKSSIHFEAGEQVSYSYRVEDVQEYNNLDRQDMAYISKTVMKNGVELGIENCEWIVMGQTPTDDGLVPNLFKAVVTYVGTATGSHVSGYTASFQYTGTVEKNVPGSTLVSVVFRGEKIAEPEPMPEKKLPLFPIVVFSLAGVAAFATGIVVFARKNRKAQPEGRRVYAAQTVDVDNLRAAAESGYDDSDYYDNTDENTEDFDEESMEEGNDEYDGEAGLYDGYEE